MKSFITPITLAASLIASSALADPGAFLEITLAIPPENRSAAAAVYVEFKQPFLTTVEGAETKVLLVRDEDVQVLHGFATMEDASAYLSSDLFQNDVFVSLRPYFEGDPDVRIYTAN
jgi:hypothetical protein